MLTQFCAKLGRWICLTLTSLYMGSLFREGLYCSHNTVKTVNLPLWKHKRTQNWMSCKMDQGCHNYYIAVGSDPGRIWVHKFGSLFCFTPYKIPKNKSTHWIIFVSYPSTASSRNQIKFNRGWTKGGPFSMDGCFSVYVLNTTEAPFLFFKQRNLEDGIKHNRIKTWEQGHEKLL